MDKMYIKRAIDSNMWLKICIECRQLAEQDSYDFVEYAIPSSFVNVTGSICPDCLGDYFARKDGMIEK